ncbi:MAG: hypothetical protein WCV41_01850 [Patescibacteria group bacterium]
MIILFLIYQATVPFGKITYAVSPCDSSFFIQKLKPKDRLAEVDKKNCAQKIIGEPIYFNLNTERTFNEAKVTLTYRDSGQNNIMEMGLQADKQKNYWLKSLENKIIDKLNWNKIEDNGVTLLQRKPKFTGVAEFLKNVNNLKREEILTYQYDLPVLKYIQGYKTETGLLRHSVPRNDIPPLRGAYQFYTYIKNEPLNFNFTFSDLNINQDADNIKITVYHDNAPVAEKELTDARGGEERREKISAGELNFNLSNLPEGFYKIAVSADDDVITEKIDSSQQIISFINRIWLADPAFSFPPLTKGRIKEGLTLYADAPEVTISTLNAASLQTVLVNEQELKLAETYRQFSLPTRQAKSKIYLEKSDVIISGAGVFSFSDGSLYNPNYKKMTKVSDVDAEKINYVITAYPPAQTTGEWKTKTVSFDLTKAFRYENNYSFMISVPGLIADDQVEDYVEIKNIKVELSGKTLWQKLKN